MTPTIRDVALRAGVSPITASRAFSGTHPVAEETRRRVLAAAEELGYVPDLLARGLVHKRSPIVGMVVLELANPFIAPVIDAVQAAARQRGYLLVVSQSERQLALEQASLQRLQEMRVAGVLVAPVSADLRHLERLRDRGTPVVAIARHWDGGDYVSVDDQAGGRLAGEHLAGLGHRRVGTVALGEESNTAVEARLAGFYGALQQYGAACAPEWRLYAEQQTPEDGASVADAFLAIPDRPAAVFVTADRLAIGFVHRLRERGLRVPGDVAVVGYDNIPYNEFLEVPLTTVAVSMGDLGRLAAEIVFERIDSRAASGEWRQVKLAPELIVRASCGGGARE